MVRNICLALALVAMAGVASAKHTDSHVFAKHSDTHEFNKDSDSDDSNECRHEHWFDSCKPEFKRHHQPVSAPEIDPSSAIVGLTLTMGGLAVLRGRRKTVPARQPR
jgi:hypothetical protein